jgi:putative two-component system response regulator
VNVVIIQKNVLFVDDDQNFLDSIRRAIITEKYPWNITTINSTSEALELDGIDSFDVILTDLLMPQPDGFWFIEQLQQNPSLKHIPVIVLTGVGEDHLKRKALEMGAFDIISKPIHPDDLFVHISNALRIKEYQDDLARRNKVLEKEIIRRTRQLELSRIEIIWKLARAGEIRDEQTENHVIRVGYYSQILARALQLPDEEVYLIFLTSPLHDIGKIGIPEHILRKPLPLSPDEMNTIRNHTIFGNQLLLERSNHEIMIMNQYLEEKKELVQTGTLTNPFLEKAAEIALTHHENWDGSGYPYGRKMEEIPLSGRIVAVADNYDAMRSKRPYKPAYSQDETVRLINSEAGFRFDPEVIRVFNLKIYEIQAIWDQFDI